MTNTNTVAAAPRICTWCDRPSASGEMHIDCKTVSDKWAAGWRPLPAAELGSIARNENAAWDRAEAAIDAADHRDTLADDSGPFDSMPYEGAMGGAA